MPIYHTVFSADPVIKDFNDTLNYAASATKHSVEEQNALQEAILIIDAVSTVDICKALNGARYIESAALSGSDLQRRAKRKMERFEQKYRRKTTLIRRFIQHFSCFSQD